MKIFTKKNLILKIVIVLVFVILFNFCAPTMSFASVESQVGGMLFEPIKDLLLTIGDGIVNMTQSILFGTESSLMILQHKNDTLGDILQGIVTIGSIAISIAVLAGSVAAAIPSGGISLATAGPVIAAVLGTAGKVAVVGGATWYLSGKAISTFIPETLYLPMYRISPEEIFSNRIPVLDVNFFNPKTNEYYENLDASIPGDSTIDLGDEPASSAAILQSTIANWYVALRNLCIVALLSILLYIGIRIVISSSSQDKAKYKQRLMDWIVGMCLLFFMHYIMSFAVTFTEMLVTSIDYMNPRYVVEIGNSDDGITKDYYFIYNGENAGSVFDNSSDSYSSLLREQGFITKAGSTDTEGASEDEKQDSSTEGTSEEENQISSTEYFIWPTNMMGKARLELQLQKGDTQENQLLREFGYTLIFVALVIYTMLFLFRYLKRLLMLAFLTIIAPFVAMTYPLDKISDGNAQAFNLWLKEYIYNLLIQPVHLILYTVLIGSAISLVMDNLLYGIVALGFILQAEKVVRKFFGFEKATTLSGGSALGGALAMQGINQLRKLSGSKKQKGGNQSGGKDEDGKINYNRKPDAGKSPEELMEQMQGNNNKDARNSTNSDTTNVNDKNEQQRMLDAYDENYGTDEWNPQERDTMARDAYDSESMNYSEEEYRNILRDSGYDEDEINEMVSKDSRYANNVDNADESYQYAPTHTEHAYTSNEENKPKEKTHRLRGAAAVLGAGVKYVAPKAARLAVKGTVAGAAGLAGIAAGLVSDDYSNVFKYGAAGLGAGWIAGGEISSIPSKVNGFGQAIGNTWENAASTYTVTAHGEKAEEERQKKIQDTKAMLDNDRLKLYKRKLKLNSTKEAREAMKDAQKYRESGITDDELIIKAMKADKDYFGEDRASKERIILAGLAEEVGTSKKQLDRMKKGLDERGFSKEQINKYSDAIKEINDWTF